LHKGITSAIGGETDLFWIEVLVSIPGNVLCKAIDLKPLANCLDNNVLKETSSVFAELS
jgi:hypothetical protein